MNSDYDRCINHAIILSLSYGHFRTNRGEPLVQKVYIIIILMINVFEIEIMLNIFHDKGELSKI